MLTNRSVRPVRCPLDVARDLIGPHDHQRVVADEDLQRAGSRRYRAGNGLDGDAIDSIRRRSFADRGDADRAPFARLECEAQG
jgi:hypothetical protein